MMLIELQHRAVWSQAELSVPFTESTLLKHQIKDTIKIPMPNFHGV